MREHPGLEKSKRILENELRLRFTETSKLKSLKPIQAYAVYYKRFKKTYPLLLQLETLIVKQKPFPMVSTLVDAMFMADGAGIISSVLYGPDHFAGIDHFRLL